VEINMLLTFAKPTFIIYGTGETLRHESNGGGLACLTLSVEFGSRKKVRISQNTR
jgi:hypothetical protein